MVEVADLLKYLTLEEEDELNHAAFDSDVRNSFDESTRLLLRQFVEAINVYMDNVIGNADIRNLQAPDLESKLDFDLTKIVEKN